MSKKVPNFFISVEGIEGVGKSTCVSYLSSCLNEFDIQHCVTREPGGSPIAEAVRQMVLHEKYAESLHEETELLLMFAARAQHLHQVIYPAMARGEWVISDRFTDASYAYQGGGRGIDFSRIEVLEKWTHPHFQPQLTLLLDADPATALQRAKHRSAPDRIESESYVFFQRVREAYLRRAKENPERIRIVDATKNLDQVKQQVFDQLKALKDHALTL